VSAVAIDDDDDDDDDECDNIYEVELIKF